MDLIITDKLADVQAYLALSKAPVIVDIETTSLTVGKGQIVCVGFGLEDRDDVVVWWPQSPEDLAQLRVPRMVAHNSPFERRWLHSYGGKVRVHWDTMFMAHLIDENHPIGLEDLVMRLLHIAPWKQENVKHLGDEFGQMWEDRASIPKQAWAKSKRGLSIYNGRDIHTTRLLLKWQRRHVRKNLMPHEDPVRVMREVMIPAIEPLRQMEDNRMPVRVEKIAKTKEIVEARIAKIEQQLDKSIPPKEQWPEWMGKRTPKWGATDWTKWWLYYHQGATVPKRNKPSKSFPDGAPAMSKDDLEKVDHPGARLLIRRSELYGQLTKFLVPLTERTVDGRVSTSFNLTGTVTGRLSSSSPGEDNPGLNSQQIPRDKATRNLFGEPGMAWIEADFSQLELRVAAVLANEPTMIALFEADEDIHSYIAGRLIKGGEVTKKDRTLAKGVNFGFLYGMMAKHFASYVQSNYGVTTTRKEAEMFREEYFNNFSGLEPWYRKQRREAIEFGGVHNEFGRFRHLPKVYADDFWIQENAFRQAINSPVQSTGSDFMLISLGRVASDLRLQRLGARLVTTVHDSVCLTAPYSTARRVGHIVKETMEQADDKLTRKFFLKADITISRSWGGEALAEF